MASMTSEARDSFLSEPRIAKLSYLLPDGSPTVIPIWFEWDGSEARMFTSRRSQKIEHLTRDPRVALSVETATGEPEAWVTIEGTARIEDGGWEVAQRLAPRYYTPEKCAAALKSWEASADEWVTLHVTPTRIRSLA